MNGEKYRDILRKNSIELMIHNCQLVIDLILLTKNNFGKYVKDKRNGLKIFNDIKFLEYYTTHLK